MNNIFFFIIIIFILYYIYNYPNYKETFIDNSSNLTNEQINIINNLSPHLIAIKNLGDLSKSFFLNDSLIIPGDLNITGDLNVDGNLLNNGNMVIGNNSTVNGILNNNGDVILNNINFNKDAVFNENTNLPYISANNLTIKQNFNINNSKLNENALYDLQNTQMGNINVREGKEICIKFQKPFKNIPHVIFTIGKRYGQYKSWNGYNSGSSQTKPISIDQNGFCITINPDYGSDTNGLDMIWLAFGVF